MIQIEILYVADCPHYPAVFALAERVRAEVGLEAEVRSVLVTNDVRPPFPGSPAIRVGGRPVEPGAEGEPAFILCCRLDLQGQEQLLRDALIRAVRV